MNLSKMATKMVFVLAALSFCVILGGVIYNPSLTVLPFVLGVSLTGGLNLLRVKLLDSALGKAVAMDQGLALHYLQIQYFLRFILTGVVLFAAALTPFISIWGAAFGVLIWPVAAYALKLFVKDADEDNSSAFGAGYPDTAAAVTAIADTATIAAADTATIAAAAADTFAAADTATFAAADTATVVAADTAIVAIADTAIVAAADTATIAAAAADTVAAADTATIAAAAADTVAVADTATFVAADTATIVAADTDTVVVADTATVVVAATATVAAADTATVAAADTAATTDTATVAAANVLDAC
ncbi:MAG: hypothetical protein FWF83_00935 [Clostridiales bacterium]|nr:hypothetical protein [Clostridiales bacterium]